MIFNYYARAIEISQKILNILIRRRRNGKIFRKYLAIEWRFVPPQILFATKPLIVFVLLNVFLNNKKFMLLTIDPIVVDVISRRFQKKAFVQKIFLYSFSITFGDVIAPINDIMPFKNYQNFRLRNFNTCCDGMSRMLIFKI